MKLKRPTIMLLAVFIGALVSGCATNIKATQELPSQVQTNAVVKQASVEIASGVETPTDTAQKLEAAVMKAASTHVNGTTPVKLKLTITAWSVRDAGTRFLGGALAGSNKMSVAVDVLDAVSGATLGHYQVDRSSNPGGYGIFYDQGQATIEQTAKGVIEGLYQTGKKG